MSSGHTKEFHLITWIKSWFIGDRRLILVLAVIDIALIWVAKVYFYSLNEMAIQPLFVTKAEIELQEIDQLEKIAATGSWEHYEHARLEKVAHYMQSTIRPGVGLALYFYPETLPPQSLEQEFAITELKTGLDALRNAVEKHQPQQAVRAYRKLRSRVENYELGANGDSNALSKEAQSFLRVHKIFTQFD